MKVIIGVPVSLLGSAWPLLLSAPLTFLPALFPSCTCRWPIKVWPAGRSVWELDHHSSLDTHTWVHELMSDIWYLLGPDCVNQASIKRLRRFPLPLPPPAFVTDLWLMDPETFFSKWWYVWNDSTLYPAVNFESKIRNYVLLSWSMFSPQNKFI